jgi:D-3-phosphoglycerate dehydrogenase
MSVRIAVTPRSLSEAGHPALSPLEQRGYEIVYPAPGRMPAEADLLRSIPGCVGWLAGVEPVTARVLEAAHGLRVISRNGSGVDNIDLAAAAAHGVRVERAQGANARGVAELAIALMLAGFRRVPWSDARLRAGGWDRKVGIEAEGRTLGVVGCGAIGRIVARLGLGLGMEVLGFDPLPDAGFAPGPGFAWAPLSDVLRRSDAISLHCPPGERPIVDAAAVTTMRWGVFLINTARAELLDEVAVLDGLNSGRIAGLATDVFRREPPSPSPLLTHENVILTPHAGGLTAESVERATRRAVANLLAALDAL